MAASPRRVCWDACVWIALIQQERIVEDGLERYARCRSVIDLAAKSKIEIVCSALCIAEVCKVGEIQQSDPNQLAAFFQHEYLLTVPLGREIAERARGLIMDRDAWAQAK